ncbi:MAG: Uncharacterized lipoprotein aminopeptidase LpqL [uncultured Solirubrobacteraceae bacterium]|uniref:Uncharacterized lipoprotein aminopeptidase LpqL n=1 Tax=uncultured Solirubrobacteraceae bacterium TaxID=1162706 RepID=A0A6J4RDF6_9ACTN|nr:MAG: Uncharacterized lipoprotein aminopeptidase LpqL [uncultured Solirubrobacteraceae bacterium]
MVRLSQAAAVTVTALVLLAHAAPAAFSAPTAAPPGQASKLTKGVTVGGIMEHLRALQAIADANGGTRAAGTPGYDDSVAYVVQRLRTAGYDPVVQNFPFPYYEKLGASSFSRTAPTATTFVEGVDFDTINYSGSGAVSGTVQAVDVNFANPSVITSGCEAADFAGFTAGNVALLQRGTCTFEDKIQNATEAGAVGVIIFNQGNGAGRSGLLTGVTASSPRAIPVVTTTFALGQQLAAPGTAVAITTNTISETRQVANVLADTPRGDDGKVTVVGAHLDSVVEGPGINDNGSGSGAILEIAEEMAENNIKPRNTVRFAWWGAEEAGLVGSEFYVDSLSEDELDDIALNLNFDMLGSPNYARLVYDGDGSDTGGAGPPGSAAIEQVFRDYFARRGLPVLATEFSGRSDYGPFIAPGIDIPAGGLFSGAEQRKTQEQFELFGGTLGGQLDPCYHEACDTIANVDQTILDQMADAAAFATVTFAFSKASVTETTSRPGKGKSRAGNFARKGSHFIK